MPFFDDPTDNSPRALRRRIESLEGTLRDLNRQVAELRGQLHRVGFSGGATDSFHDREDARLRGMIFALVELLVERGGLDQEEAVARLDAALGAVEAEPVAQPGPFDATSPATANTVDGCAPTSGLPPTPAENTPIRCGACGGTFPARETYHTGSGLICEACRAKQMSG